MIGYIKEAFSKAGEHVDRKSNMAAGIRKMINPMKMPNNSGKREAKNAKSLLIRKACETEGTMTHRQSAAPVKPDIFV